MEPTDLCGRFGWENKMLILKNATREELIEEVKRLRKEVKKAKRGAEREKMIRNHGYTAAVVNGLV